MFPEHGKLSTIIFYFLIAYLNIIYNLRTYSNLLKLMSTNYRQMMLSVVCAYTPN